MFGYAAFSEVPFAALGKADVGVEVTGVQGVGQVVEEPHEWNVKYATYPSANTFDIVPPPGSPKSGIDETYSLALFPSGVEGEIRATWLDGGFSYAGRVRFALGTAWDLNSASYTTEFSSANESGQSGLGGICPAFGPDIRNIQEGGSRPVYFGNASAKTVRVANGSSVSAQFVSASGVLTNDLYGVFARPVKSTSTSTTLFVSQNGGTVFQFSGGTFNSPGTFTYDNKSFATGKTYGISFDTAGTRFYMSSGDIIHQYALSTPWDISTAVDAQQQSPDLRNLLGIGTFSTAQISWKPDGKQFFAAFNNQKAYRFSISPTTATVESTGTANVFPTGVAATASVGAVEAGSISAIVLIGVSATGEVGQLGAVGMANVSATGVSATGEIGQVTAAIPADVLVTGVAATGGIGDAQITGSSSVVLTGVSATGAVGQSQAVGTTGVSVTVAGVQGTGQIVQEPHEWNVKYATYPSANTFDIVHPQGSLSFSNTYSMTILSNGTDVVIRGNWTGNNTGAGRIVFSLSTPWDLSSASYVTNYASQTQTGSGTGFGGLDAVFDSTRAYIGNASSEIVRVATGSTVSGSTLDVSGVLTNELYGIFSRPVATTSSSTTLFLSQNGGTVYQYSGGSFASPGSFTYDNKSFSTGKTYGITFDTSGTRFYMSTGGVVHQYALSTPWDLSTAVDAQQQSPDLRTLLGIATFATAQISWKPDGKQFFASFNNQKAYRFSISATTATVNATGNADAVVTGVAATGGVGQVVVPNASFGVTGVQATGQVGSVLVASDESVFVFVEGVEALGQVGQTQVSGSSELNLVGTEATGEVGQAIASIFAEAVVSGVEALADVGAVDNVTGTADVSPEGVAGLAEQGAVNVEGDATVSVDGVGADGQVGDSQSAVSIDVLLIGVEALGQVFAVAVTGTANVFPEGVTGAAEEGAVNTGGDAAVQLVSELGTGEIGDVQVTGTALVSADGVEGNASVGSAQVEISVDVPLTGLEATGEIGSAAATEGLVVFATGVTGTGQVGILDAEGDANQVVDGVEADGEIGQAEGTSSFDAVVQGVEGNGQVGSVEVEFDVEVVGVQGDGQVGAIDAQGDANLSLTGVAGSGQVGSVTVQGAANALLTGVLGSGEVGAVEAAGAVIVILGGTAANAEVGDTQVAIGENAPVTGVSGQGGVGQVAALPSALAVVTGLQAQFFVGTVATFVGDASVTLTGVQGNGVVGTTVLWNPIVPQQDAAWSSLAA